MLEFLKKHPFAVEAYFESSLVLTFAIPKEELQPMVPDCLSLDVFNDQFAFIAVAMVRAKSLRPKGFPAILGNDFFLTGYRIFVRYTTQAEKHLRGLYILKSETDKRMMELLGNIFTHYNYTKTDITYQQHNENITVASADSSFYIKAYLADEVPLPKNSPFTDWKEARRFAGPLPFTFTYLPGTNEVLIVKGMRENWEPKAVNVIEYNLPFLNSLHLSQPVLANAFIINNIPYHWEKGITEKWTR